MRISLWHGCRAIPITWTVVQGTGLVKVARLKGMLEKVQRFMKKYVSKAIFLADAGFRGCDWAQICLKLGWDYGIRVACNTFLTLANGICDRLDHLVPVNCNRYFQKVWLTKAAKLLTNMSVTWITDKKGQPEMIAIITKRLACHARLHEYSYCMSIEQSFRDDQTGGFDYGTCPLAAGPTP